MTATEKKQQAARDRLTELSAAYTAAETALDRAREILSTEIVSVLKARTLGPSEVTRLVPFERQHVGRIAKAGGVPPLREPTVVSAKQAATQPAPEPNERPSPPTPMKFPARIFALIPDRAKAVALLAYERADEEQRPILVAARQRAGQQNATNSERDRAVIAAAMKLDPPLVTEADLV